jgi:hypothetical protein
MGFMAARILLVLDHILEACWAGLWLMFVLYMLVLSLAMDANKTGLAQSFLAVGGGYLLILVMSSRAIWLLAFRQRFPTVLPLVLYATEIGYAWLKTWPYYRPYASLPHYWVLFVVYTGYKLVVFGIFLNQWRRETQGVTVA